MSLSDAALLATNGLPLSPDVYVTDPEFRRIGDQLERHRVVVEYVDFAITRSFGGASLQHPASAPRQGLSGPAGHGSISATVSMDTVEQAAGQIVIWACEPGCRKRDSYATECGGRRLDRSDWISLPPTSLPTAWPRYLSDGSAPIQREFLSQR
ncbi:hypothetical protein [Occultella aeris]|uniref:hypothetical protein n=1 Tax=Occultella aeris TaxID=2761496 RepID=UPI0012EAE360|nr:hypothetical protein [Occultella aeris]